MGGGDSLTVLHTVYIGDLSPLQWPEFWPNGIIFHQTLIFFCNHNGISRNQTKKATTFWSVPIFLVFFRVGSHEFDPEKTRKIHPGLPLQCTRSKASQVNSNRRWPVISSPILGQRKKKSTNRPKNPGFLNKRFFQWNEPLTSNKKIVVMNFTRFMKCGLLHTKNCGEIHYFFKALFLEVRWKMCWTWRCHDHENRGEKRSSSHESSRPGFLCSNKYMFAKLDTL